jgi:hypothetical protein
MKVNKLFYCITLVVLLGHGLGILLGHPAVTQHDSDAVETFYLPFTEPSANFVLTENQQFNPLTPKIKVQLPGMKSPGNIQINSYHKYNLFLHFNIPLIAYKYPLQACNDDG